MKLEPGMRVRCVRPASTYLTLGEQYLIERVTYQYVWIVDDTGKSNNWLADRFKPVVRVKAPTSRLSNLEQMVDRCIFAQAGR